MTSPFQAVTTDDGRYYPRHGKHYPSVTTILGKTLPKPALMYWAAREVAQMAVNLIEGKHEWPRVDGNQIGPDALVKYLKTEPLTQRDNAGSLGTTVHGYCEEILVNGYRGMSLQMLIDGITDKKVRDRVHQFGLWVTAYDVKPVHIEATVYSDKYQYAGSCDLMAWVDGVLTIIDFKTSKGVYASTALQLVAYRFADVIVTDDGEELALPQFEKGAVLHIKPRSYTYRELDVSLRQFENFKLLVKILRLWHNSDEKTALMDIIQPTSKE